MRGNRLLSRLRIGESRGSAVVESVFAILFLLFISFALIEIALILYGRNVVAAAAHEGARAGLEFGRNPSDAQEVAARTIRDAAAGLVDDLEVAVSVTGSGEDSIVHVRLTGTLASFGPVPLSVPVATEATASLERVENEAARR